VLATEVLAAHVHKQTTVMHRRYLARAAAPLLFSPARRSRRVSAPDCWFPCGAVVDAQERDSR
jgi:hypothetical protein